VPNNQISNKQIIIDKLVINYYFFLPKKKSNKTLVFLHGWGVDSKLWFKIVPELINQNYSLYFIDLPGFGQSQVPDSIYDVDDYKKIVYEFIKKLGLKKGNIGIAAFCEYVKANYLITENRHFLKELKTKQFKIRDAEDFIKEIMSYSKGA